MEGLVSMLKAKMSPRNSGNLLLKFFKHENDLLIGTWMVK